MRVSAPNDDTGGQLEAEVLIASGSRVFTVSLKKPLGLVLAGRVRGSGEGSGHRGPSGRIPAPDG